MITVFYDGACGLCAREIKYYQKIAPAGRFSWVDISADASTLEVQGITQEEGLKNLHVQDDAGTLHKGVEAFICIWRGLPYFKALAFVAGLPVIKQVLKLGYRGFAHWRYQRQQACALPRKP